MYLNPLTLGDTPEEFLENPDGSVDIPNLDDPTTPETGEFAQNLAEFLDESELTSISSDLIEFIEKDKKSREKRDQQYEEGLRRSGLGNDAPGGAEFEGASKVVHPVLAEACVDFSSRAIKELFPAAGPVKPWIAGDNTPQKQERAQRKTRFMNWQLTTQMPEYRSELEQLLTQLPMGGSQYQKFWYDERLRRPACEFVSVDEIYLPYLASNFYTAPRVTHRQLISRQEFRRRVSSGLYRDIFISDTTSLPEQSASTQANDRIEGREEDGYNEDGLRAILEIYCWWEVNGDSVSAGEYAPYIITIDEDTEKVVGFYRNWEEGDNNLEKLDWFVEWKFIPWRGAYAIGLPHLIGGLSAALTGALRALLDSAHINNTATMLKLKSGRIVGQNTQVNVTQVCDIEGPAGIDDIRKMAMAMPFNPPSPVLHSLMQDLYGLAKGVVQTAEDQIGQVGDRTPVGTTMALVEQGSTTYSAIHARLHESQKKALQILHRINSKWLDEQVVVEDLGEQVVSRDDFSKSMDVIPVSDPTIFSEAQRFAQTQAIIQMSADPSVPWNKINVYRRALKQMRIEGIDELLPPNKEPFTGNILDENFQAMTGVPLKAHMDQNHLAHAQGHLGFLTTQLQNPLTAPQALMAMLGHVNEHLQMFQQQAIKSMLVIGSDEEILAALTHMHDPLTQQIQPFIQQISQLQPEIQKRMPQPQMPPEVQASIQIAQMDINRKAQLDQATLQMKNQENTLRSQLEQAQFQAQQSREQFDQQLKAAQQQFEQFMRQAEEQRIAQNESLSHQVELLKNEQDNHQKQVTELLKNRDDNDTKVLIEQMKAQLTDMQSQMTQSGERDLPTDFTPQLKELQMTLDQMGKQQTNDALTEAMNGIRAMMEHMSRPRQTMFVKDDQGKVIGAKDA